MRRPSRGKLVKLTLLAWLGQVGFDFVLHAGVLADLYERDDPFLLAQEDAFRYIPLGYLAFLVFTILLVRVVLWRRVDDGRRGFLVGLELGALLWLGISLALASITTASWTLLLWWFIGQTLELAIAGWIVGAGIAAKGLRGLTIRVTLFVFACVVGGVVLQNL